ncbi:MAG TPA: hypothetical protein VKZ79_21530 [Alphaproteobacteria bacterium]|nr:hypothetical protein [Alphaproteobacteria bacterium]
MGLAAEPARYRQRINDLMRPISEPVVIEDVYSDAQYETLMEVVRRNGPWPTIMAHHFTTVEQVIATNSGQVPENITLDDLTRPNFRGFFAEDSVCYYPELYDCFYSRKFLDAVKSYWGAQYAKPTMYLFNFSGPMGAGLTPHTDATTFRGVRRENSPLWLQNVMTKSGLFQNYMIKTAQVITWWYKEGIGGSFTYWPDGPLNPPKAIRAPMWNRGVIVQNEMMFHRGDASGPVELRNPPGVKFRSLLENDPADRSCWIITTDGEPIARYHTDRMRLLVHWSADLYTDMAEWKKVMNHTDDLTHDQVFETLMDDLRARGIAFTPPADPLHDNDFIGVLIKAYDIMPEILEVPAERAA